MRVGVDAAGQDVLAARVDHAVGRDVERLADQRDPLALHEDIGEVVVGRGDDAATLDQDGAHRSKSRTEGRAAATLRSQTAPYLPPAVSVTFAGFQPLPLTSTPPAFSSLTAFWARAVR